MKKDSFLILFLFTLLCAWLANSVFLNARSILIHNEKSDASAYYSAAMAKAAGHENIFDVSTLKKAVEGYLPPEKVRPYQYPPLLAELLSKLMPMKYKTFRVGWMLAEHLAIILLLLASSMLVKLIIHNASGSAWAPPTLHGWPLTALTGLIILVAYSPLERNIHYGQVSLFCTAALFLCMLLTFRGNQVTAGVLLGFSIIVKPFALCFMPGLLYGRHFRSLATCLATIAALVTMSGISFGWTDWNSFLGIQDILTTNMFEAFKRGSLDQPNYSLLKLALLMGSATGLELNPWTAQRIITILVISLLLFSLWSKRRELAMVTTHNTFVMTNIFIVAMLSLNVQLWNHNFLLLIPGYLWLAMEELTARQNGDNSKTSYLLAASFMLVATADFGTNLKPLLKSPLAFLALTKLYGMIIFGALMIKKLRGDTESSQLPA